MNEPSVEFAVEIDDYNHTIRLWKPGREGCTLTPQELRTAFLAACKNPYMKAVLQGEIEG